MKHLRASFRDAFRGLWAGVRHHRNVRIHLLATLAVLAAAAVLRVPPWGWAALLLACGLVMGLELLNSALETLCDKVHPERDPLIGRCKDLSAGAVLWAALMAAGVAVAVFGGAVLW